MKKLTLTLLSSFLFITLAMAQIPNSGFENWTNMGTYNNPDQWGTMNNLSSLVSVFTAEKGTPGFSGSAYLKLTSKTTIAGVLNGIAVSGKIDSMTMMPKSGFAYNLRPQNFTGKWQHMIYGTSQGAMTATLTKWNTGLLKRDTVAIANLVMTGMVMSWGTFTIPFVYNSGEYPDSCIIFLRASGPTPSNQDFLYVDDLAFTGSVAGIEAVENTSDNLGVFPNPASDIIMLDLNLVSSSPAFIELSDINGRVIKTKAIGELNGLSKQNFDVSDMPAGSYMIKVCSSKKELTQKVIIQ